MEGGTAAVRVVRIGSVVFHVLRRQYVRIVRQVGSGYIVTSGGPEFFSSGLWLRVSE